jgi:hypothetical protein
MTDGDRREPLWASSLADQPQREPDVFVRWERDEPEPPPPRAEVARRPAGVWAWLAAAAALLLAAAVVSALTRGGSVAVVTVPSYWDDIPMTCRTARVAHGPRGIELFECRAPSGELPPGVYRSPDSQWSSDLTRQRALVDGIVISDDGVARGWAVYR